MIVVTKKKGCLYRGCSCKAPSFNVEGEKKGSYCAKHKLEGMVDVKNKRCAEPGCTKQPHYNFGGERKGIHCGKHKQAGMVNVTSKRCAELGCGTRPSYNEEGKRGGLFCKVHGEPKGLIMVIGRRCAEPGCNKHPNFNMEGMKRALYCQQHGAARGMVDVRNNRCAEPGCNRQPTYNYEGKKGRLFCKSHGEPRGMVDVANKDKQCAEPGCHTRSSFNYEGKRAGLYCRKHKQDGMIDVLNFRKRCKSDWCDTLASNPRYKGYCLHCFIHLFPDQPTARNYKTKEQAVVDYITGEFPELDWTADKRVADGCSRRRPDLLADLGYQVLIIEVDEDQHRGYDCSCENKRIMELSQDLDHRNIVFIRFNPDTYYHNGKKVLSCWHVNKQGICVVKKTKRIEWQERLAALRSQVELWKCEENKSDRAIQTVDLFFDT